MYLFLPECLSYFFFHIFSLQFHNEEHIFTARELSDVNGVHDEIANFYSTNSNGREMEKNTKNKKTGKLLEGEDIPLLSENEKRELVSLVKDKNISMDFILEMKEAFLLFDKVRLKMFSFVIKFLSLVLLTNLIEILTTMDSFLLFAQNLEFGV